MPSIPEDLTALPDDELLALDDELAKERLALAEAHKPVQVERERRQVAAEAAARVAHLSDEEKAALAQALAVDGIDATED